MYEKTFHINCSDPDREFLSHKKVLNIKAVDLRNSFCNVKYFAIRLQERKSAIDTDGWFFGGSSHTNAIIKPVIYTSDENLRSVSPVK